MRHHCLAVASALLVGSTLFAQQPPATLAQPIAPPAAPAQAAPPSAPPAQPAPAGAAAPRLDLLLKRWEQEMTNVRTLIAQCTREELNNVNMTTEVFTGSARYMRPNLAMLDMQKKSNPQVYEKYICNGTSLYEYRPKNKLLRIHELPPPRAGQVSDDGFLSFLFGMKADEAKRRYDLTLVKEDENWIYLKVIPRMEGDKMDFQEARLVLSSKTFLPRQLWFKQPNSNEVKWDIPQMQSGVQLKAADFAPPPTAKDWTVQRVPRAEAAPPRNDLPPRVVRPQQ
jgi:TIGR03009 family protein